MGGMEFDIFFEKKENFQLQNGESVEDESFHEWVVAVHTGMLFVLWGWL